MGIPECPEFAAATASSVRVRIQAARAQWSGFRAAIAAMSMGVHPLWQQVGGAKARCPFHRGDIKAKMKCKADGHPVVVIFGLNRRFLRRKPCKPLRIGPQLGKAAEAGRLMLTNERDKSRRTAVAKKSIPA